MEEWDLSCFKGLYFFFHYIILLMKPTH